MKVPKELPIKVYWRYVDELDGRGLDLSYPEEVIKGVKRMCMNAGINNMTPILLQKEPYRVFINNPQDNIPYEAHLAPPVFRALQSWMAYEWKVNAGNSGFGSYKSCIPTTAQLLPIFLEEDKYFSMCLTLRKELPSIVHNIKLGNYRYSAVGISSLTDKYNMEIVKLINDYFNTHKFYDTAEKRWYSFYIVNNRSYIMTRDAYIAVLIYKYYVNHDIADTDVTLVYENYDVLTMPDPDHQIKRGKGKSFLQDCKKVALIKKELLHTTIGVIEFHDLIRYGGYNDKILSIENVTKVSEIFGHNKWLVPFFTALGLYCDNYLNIDQLREDLNTEKYLVDPRKIRDVDRFIQTVDYFDSIYDSLIAE